jgi:hypothetical protein
MKKQGKQAISTKERKKERKEIREAKDEEVNDRCHRLNDAIRPAKLLALSFCVFASAFTPAQASGGETVAVLSGSAAQTQSKIVCSKIKWLTSLDEARETARRENKLIVWIHMLGNIDGFT